MFILSYNQIVEMTSEMRKGVVRKFRTITKTLKLAREIERGIYDEIDNEVGVDSHSFKRLYANKCVSIYRNLDRKSDIGNKDLLRSVKKGGGYELGGMTPMELFPENWRELIEKIEATERVLEMQDEGVTTDQYTCGRCKKKRCSYYMMQTRSADEGSTIFVTCMECDHKWKM